MNWLTDYADKTRRTNRFVGKSDEIKLLTAGLFGESGSILSEFKKVIREQNAYPIYREKLREEIGDFLWYFTKISDHEPADLHEEFDLTSPESDDGHDIDDSSHILDLGQSVGALVSHINSVGPGHLRHHLLAIWTDLKNVSQRCNISLEDAAAYNLDKVKSRWPEEREFHALFDDGEFPEEQLPRKLTIDFVERKMAERPSLILRINSINFGDRLTDNIVDSDGYRYHDIFHFSFAVHLGWSPVLRSLLKCKRKSKPDIDEGQDGARAAIVEEGVSTLIFNRGKSLNDFDGINHVDYDLLKSIQEMVKGYEVDRIPLWQWEVAILEGYKIFRNLKRNSGGRVTSDLKNHRLNFTAKIS